MSKSTLNHFIQFVHAVKNSVDINDTISIDKLNRDDAYKIILNKRDLYYYCIELSGSSNTENFLEEQDIAQIFDNFKSETDAKIINVLLKKGDFQRNLIFSKNKKLLDFIAKKLSATFVVDIVAITYLYDIFLNNFYYTRDKKQYSNFSLDKLNLGNVSTSFNHFVKDAIALQFEDTHVYQAYTIKSKINNAQISKFFKLNFTGSLFNTIDFSRDKVSHLISTRKKEAFYDGNSEPFKKLDVAYKNGNINCAVFNSTLFAKSADVATILEIGECFGVEFAEKNSNVNKFIKNTPLIMRDSYNDIIVNDDFCKGIVGSCHKKNLEKYHADFFAKDIHGAFYNYNFSYTTDENSNKSSDFTIIGIKGTGKTTFGSAMIAQMLNFNPTENEEKEKKLGSFEEGLKRNKIRYFDIKKSGYTVMKLLEKKDPKAVNFIETSLNRFKFNLLNIKYIKDSTGKIHLDRDELALNVLLISIIIESKNKSSSGEATTSTGLNAFEVSILSKAITDIYENSLFDSRHIISFQEDYPEIYKELIAKGYMPNQNINEVKDGEYDYLKVPTLNTLIKYVSGLKEDARNATLQKHSDSLHAYLTLIDSMGIFSGFDRVNYDDVNIMHIDFDPVKDLSEYVPIFLSLFLKMYRNDKIKQEALSMSNKRGERPYISYIFEEAKNVTEQPSFKEFFLKISNEARSYRIKLGFVTQLVSHIPPQIFSQVSNKFFLLPAKNQKENLIQEIDEAINIDEDTKKLLRDTPEFGVVLINEHGSSSFSLDISEDEIEIFGQSQ